LKERTAQLTAVEQQLTFKKMIRLWHSLPGAIP
jgi:hypothetical protein